MHRLRIVLLAPVLTLAPLLSLACSGDDGTGDDGTGTSPNTSPGTMGDDGGSETMAPGDDGGSDTMGPGDDGGSDSTGAPGDDGGEPGPPEIVGVTWTNVDGCAMNTGSDVTVEAEVTDPDNDESELTFEIMAIGCTTSSSGPTSVLFCPQAAPYSVTLTVTDPDANEDELDFMIMPCVDGSAP